MYLYYKSSDSNSPNKVCSDPHTIKLSFSIDNMWIYRLYFIFMIITVVSICAVIITFFFGSIKGNFNLLRNVADFSTIIIGYGLGIVFDYTQRAKSQRFFLMPIFISLTFLIIAMLILALVCILLPVFF